MCQFMAISHENATNNRIQGGDDSHSRRPERVRSVAMLLARVASSCRWHEGDRIHDVSQLIPEPEPPGILSQSRPVNVTSKECGDEIR
jgi:hypothetical protein